MAAGFGILTTGDVSAVPNPALFANTNNGGGASAATPTAT